jgi:uncharacterized protein YhaN
MKLLECYIENFGKLSKFSYHFEPGMNVLLRENGWGKTTFAAFLKAMLYGLGTSRSSDLQQNERLRYTPWQGGKCGGTLTFSTEKGIWRVERFFGARESGDTFALYDCATGLPSTAYTEKLGEELFGINATGYERSTFISERLTSDGAEKDYTGIQAKLVDMNDLSDFEIADKKLNKRRQYYQVQGGRGLISDTERALSARKTELEDTEAALRQTNDLNRRARELDSKREALELSLKELRRKMDASVTVREARALDAHRDDLIRNLDRCREQTASCRAYLSGNIPSSAAVEEQLRAHRTLNERKRPESSVRQISPLLPFLLSVCGIICAGVGIALGSLFRYLYLIGPICGALLLGAGLCCSYLRRRAQQTLQALRASQGEYDRMARDLAAFLSGFPIVNADPALKNNGERLWAIRTKLDELHHAQVAEQEAQAALDGFRTSHPEIFDGSAEKASEDDRRDSALEEQLNRQIDALRAERITCEREIARYSTVAGRYTACAQEIANLEEKLKEYRKSLDIILSTQDFLAHARANLTTRYLSDIQDRFRHYMQLLTEEDRGTTVFSDEYEADAFTVTPDFRVNITKYAQTRSAGALSRGGRDLVALCLRFSICDALFRGQNPPLILDDPFINLDDEKTVAAMHLLRKIASEKQILYVACHSSRTDLL